MSNPADVDIAKRQSLWGQIDYWTRTIRIYDNDSKSEDILQTLLHEILHGIANQLHLKALSDIANHDELDILALALVDVLVRNGWMALYELGAITDGTN
jgi:hypothetical protein